MPTYRYRCGSCGDEFEVWQSITDDALGEHDGCGGGLVKVLSPAGIVLKGSGFYKTDSRKGSSGNGASTPKESKPADTSTSDSTKSDSGTSSSDSSSKKDTSSGSKSSQSSGSGTKNSSST